MTHIATWDALCHLLGRCNFVSGADCKLAVQESMDHIDRRGGRFVSTLLASHKGGCVLAAWLVTHETTWTKAMRRAGRLRAGPDDVYGTTKHRGLRRKATGW